eukprot:PhM_4_TR8745/c0_g1_i2/m.41236
MVVVGVVSDYQSETRCETLVTVEVPVFDVVVICDKGSGVGGSVSREVAPEQVVSPVQKEKREKILVPEAKHVLLHVMAMPRCSGVRALKEVRNGFPWRGFWLH